MRHAATLDANLGASRGLWACIDCIDDAIVVIVIIFNTINTTVTVRILALKRNANQPNRARINGILNTIVIVVLILCCVFAAILIVVEDNRVIANVPSNISAWAGIV